MTSPPAGLSNELSSELSKPGEAADRSFDVIVVGSGAGGLGAAIVAATEGLKVLVLEKASVIGGTTAMSGGGVWMPANSKMHDAGDLDTPDAAMAYMQGLPGMGAMSAAELARLRAFLDAAPVALDYYDAHSSLKFSTRKYSPDYHSGLEGATRTSRAVDVQEFDGRKLGNDLLLLREPRPESLLFGGMAVNGPDIFHLTNALRSEASFLHSVRLVARYFWQRFVHGRATRLVLGRAMVARMLSTLRQLGVRIEVSSPVTALTWDGTAVTGVVATVGGAAREFRARRGVVLATGGFAHDEALSKRWIPASSAHIAVGADSVTGDGIRLGLAHAGAIRDDARDSAYWTPVSIWKRPGGTSAPFPHLVSDRAKPGLIAIDGTGQRFVNEASSYHDFVRAMHARFEQTGETSAYLVCDSDFIRRYGLGHARPWPFPRRQLVKDGYLIVARSLTELASKLGVEAAALNATVSRHNADAARGVDTHLGKGSSAYNRFMGDVRHEPNPCLAPIQAAPFYAVKVFPGNVGTSRGLRTDASARVLDRDGSVVPGLYAAGNDADSVLLGAYPGPGASLGPALTAGYCSAMHMAQRSPASSTPLTTLQSKQTEKVATP